MRAGPDLDSMDSQIGADYLNGILNKSAEIAVICGRFSANEEGRTRAGGTPARRTGKMPVLRQAVSFARGNYSGIASPEPPISTGKSFNFGRPSFIGRTVSS